MRALGVTKMFGAVRAVDDVTLDIVEGSLTCLIGPNGAGKSTLLGCISGFLVADEGACAGGDVTRQPPPACAAGARDGLPDDGR